MKKDSKDEKLPEDQLENVQGGFGSLPEEKVTIRCLYQECSWHFIGSGLKGGFAQSQHTKDTGHDQFTYTYI